MTKINKLGKSTFVIAILSFILVAVLAFGGTYAYFSATTKADSASITLGHLKISDHTKFNQTAIEAIGIAVPNQPIIDDTNGAITVTVDSNINYFIRAKLTYDYELHTAGCDKTTVGGTSTCACADAGIELLLITPGTSVDPLDPAKDTATAGSWIAGLTQAEADIENADWAEGQYKYVADVEGNSTGWYYYNKMWTPGTETGTDTGIFNRLHTFTIDARVNPETGKKSSQHFMDAVITITVHFEVIQADFIVTDAKADADNIYTKQQLQEAWATADLTSVSPIPAV